MPKVINQSIELTDGRVIQIRDDQVRAMISGNFSEDESYKKDEIVIYDDELWKFYRDHPKGEWIETDARQVTMSYAFQEALIESLSDESIAKILHSNEATSDDIAALFA